MIPFALLYEPTSLTRTLNAIELIYQISGQRKKLFLAVKLNSVNWDAEDQEAIYVSATKAKKLLKAELHKKLDELILTETEIDQVDERMSALQGNIRDIETRFELDSVVYSARMVMDKLKENRSGKTKKEDHKNFLFEFIDHYITEHTATHEKGSLGVYKSVKNHLLAYQNYTGRQVRFDSIDYSFFQRFQSYLITKVKINNTTIAKALSTLKTFFRVCQEKWNQDK